MLGPSKTKIKDIVITAEGIGKILADIKPHKASGPGRLPNRVLKELSKELAPTFATLYTQSLNSCEIPKDWSNALITPVYKKGHCLKLQTSVVSKLMEHILCSHIHAYLKENSLLTDFQCGFRKGHSCESQLLTTIDEFYTSYDAGIQPDVVILDLR